MLKIGFMGTRHGMTDEQKTEFKKLIKAKKFKEFHHGMCAGSDEIAHHLIEENKKDVNIVGHPPTWSGSVVKLTCHTILPEDTYLKRNKEIVDSTDFLIATPDAKERGGSGTWKTVRYARKKGKRIYIIHKNGRVSIE